MFDQILEKDYNNDVELKIIPKDVLFPPINNISTYQISKLRKWYEIVPPHHTIQRKIQKTVNDYSNKSIDDSKLIVVYPSPELTKK